MIVYNDLIKFHFPNDLKTNGKENKYACIRSEFVQVNKEKPDNVSKNVYTGTIEDVISTMTLNHIIIRVDDLLIRSVKLKDDGSNQKFKIGDKVYVVLPESKIHVFDN
jgi:ABC-type sugar transport system ATPase subunit